MAPSRRSFSSSAIALESRTGTLSSKACPLICPLTSPFCSVPSKPRTASASGLSTSEPLGTLALKVRAIRPSLPLARPFAVNLPAARSESSARSFSSKSKSKSAAPLAKVPLAVAEVWLLKTRNCLATIPVSPRARLPVMRVSPASRLSTGSLPIPQTRRHAVDRQVERAVDRLDAAGGVHVQGARQLASRQLRERRHAGRLHLDAAVESVVGDVPRKQDAEVIARQQRLGKADRQRRPSSRPRCPG